MADKGNDRPFTLFNALLAHRCDEIGSQKAYAGHLGVNVQTMSRWMRGETSPIGRKSRNAEREILAEDLGLSVEQLRILGSISVPQACEIVLKRIEDDPVEIEIRERFIALISQRETIIPLAAQVIYLTGDIESRRSIVETLERHGYRIKADIDENTLKLVMDLATQNPNPIK